MNRVWTRSEGLILTDWNVKDKIPFNNTLLLRSLLSCLRTGETFLFNNQPQPISNNMFPELVIK